MGKGSVQDTAGFQAIGVCVVWLSAVSSQRAGILADVRYEALVPCNRLGSLVSMRKVNVKDSGPLLCKQL